MEKVKIAICGACLVIVAILGYCYISEKQSMFTDWHDT